MAYNPWIFTGYGVINGVTNVALSTLFDLVSDAGLQVTGGDFDWEDQLDGWIKLFVDDETFNYYYVNGDKPYIPRGARQIIRVPAYERAFEAAIVSWKRLANEDTTIKLDYDAVVSTLDYKDAQSTIDAWNSYVNHPMLAIMTWAKLFDNFVSDNVLHQAWADVFESYVSLPNRLQLGVQKELEKA